MALNRAQYRIKHPDLIWEQTPVACELHAVFWTNPATSQRLWNLVGMVIGWLNGGAEVRWSFADVGQGHYVQAPAIRLRRRKQTGN